MFKICLIWRIMLTPLSFFDEAVHIYQNNCLRSKVSDHQYDLGVKVKFKFTCNLSMACIFDRGITYSAQ